MQNHHYRRMLPPIQEVIFYAQYHGTPFSNQLPPLKVQKPSDSRACHHKSNKIFCPACDGRAICKHGRNRYTCKQCTGQYIYQGNKRRYACNNDKGQTTTEKESVTDIQNSLQNCDTKPTNEDFLKEGTLKKQSRHN